MGQAYKTAMRAAAYRHLIAAESLKPGDRKDVAGYLFGIAAECGIKQLMLDSGMRPLPEADRRDDPFYAHFEKLKTMLRNTAFGRHQGRLRRYAESTTFMQHWDTSMRYSDGKDVLPDWIERWHQDAKDIINAIDT